MSSRLNKKLYTNIAHLKSLDRDDAETRFRLQSSPFTGNEDDEQLAADKREEFLVTGLIFPKSDIFRERAYQIEMKLTRTFPGDPPEVKFLTTMYHPNVAEDGKFCNELILKTAKWTATTSLEKVVKAVVDYIDNPDVDYAMRANVGQEYHEKRDDFNRKALECVRKNGLPRQ